MLCQEYARKFRAALPTELRDMVYAQVWDRETVERAFDNVCPKVPPVVLTDNLIALYDDAEEGWQPNSPWSETCLGKWHVAMNPALASGGGSCLSGCSTSLLASKLPKKLRQLTIERVCLGV
jgi:hypothetical protein